MATSGVGENGTGTGLTVSIDTYDNGAGEAPSLEIIYQGISVAFDSINQDPGLAKDFLRKNTWVEADLEIDAQGYVSFTYDGRVLTATLAGWAGITGGAFAFGARTGGASDNHWIDDLLIEVNDPPPCVPPRAGLVGWWSAEGSANDSTGINDGILVAAIV